MAPHEVVIFCWGRGRAAICEMNGTLLLLLRTSTTIILITVIADTANATKL